MKIKLSSFCCKCYFESEKTKDDYERIKKECGDDVDVEFNNENLYEVICQKGHTSYTQLQNQKFELLFDIAAMALIDGYTKECVSTIASSFERFIEFYIKVISVKKKVPVDQFAATWKLMSSQSERQLGAFYSLQLSEYGETKFSLEPKWVEFRNSVIHKGYIPTTAKAIEYGDYILSLIFSILNYLKQHDIDSITAARLIDFTKTGERIPEQQLKASANIPTIINLSSIGSAEFGKTAFKPAIDAIQNNGFYKSFYNKTI
jgi:hypothetical protein